MTISTNWEVTNLLRETADGYVYEAVWTMSATSTETDPAGDPWSIQYEASTKLPRPAGAFIPYNDLTPQLCVQWVKDRLGPENVSNLEAAVTEQLVEKMTNATSSGTPWGN